MFGIRIKYFKNDICTISHIILTSISASENYENKSITHNIFSYYFTDNLSQLYILSHHSIQSGIEWNLSFYVWHTY